MINKVILIGNLGADPEVRQTNSGTSVGNLRIATNERRKDKDGNWGDHTEWHRVVCFGKTAENAAKYLSKGRQVYIEGRLSTRKWEKDGVDTWTTEVVADNLRFIGGRDSDGGSYSSNPSGGGRSGGDASGSQGGASGGFDDDIPF